MLSYWEKNYLLKYDVIIIGSGIVGLSTALSIKERKPTKKILVLERAILPTGASTKNAGFACIGSLTEILDDLKLHTEDEVLQLVELRLKGLKILRQRLGDAAIDYYQNGSFELITEQDAYCLQEMERINTLLQPILGNSAFIIADKQIKDFGFNTNTTKHLIKNQFEGELNTGMMMRRLIDMCLVNGIEIKTGCEVVELQEEINHIHVLVAHTHLQQKISFTATQVCICTNAFSKQFYPELDLQPGRGQILITKPIAGLKFRGIFHFNNGYYYFRELNGRVLFGGGRNIDFETENTTQLAANELIKSDLLHKLQNIILPNQNFEIEDWWTGIMAFGKTKFPIIKKQSSRVFTGVRMGGMGVAIGSQVAELLADLVSKNSE